MEILALLVPVIVGGFILALIIGIELKPILTRLDKIIHLLEKK